jgi:excisionase family DNA binding protein
MKLGQVASTLGCTKGTAYTYVRNGVIPAIRLGGRLLIDTEQLEQALAKLAVGPKEK